MKVQEIADLVGGKIKGKGDVQISGVGGIEDALEGQITFLESKKYLEALNRSVASAVLVAQEIETDKIQIITSNPKLAFARLIAAFHPPVRPAPGVHPKAHLGENVVLGKNVAILPGAAINDNVEIGDNTVVSSGVSIGEGCRIGADCFIHPNVTLYSGTQLGDRVILHAGSVIGADGFGYTLDEKGRHFKIHQIGIVVIEDDVEIGANACIDRAAIGETRIKQGTKIDNLVQIAHNCTVGDHSIIVSQVGISGSCTLGKYVVLAGQVGVADHVTLGDNVTVAAQSGTFRNIESNQVYGGSPSIPLNMWKKYVTVLPKLPDYIHRIKDLEKRLEKIENQRGKDYNN